jgi:hypothetical protein
MAASFEERFGGGGQGPISKKSLALPPILNSWPSGENSFTNIKDILKLELLSGAGVCQEV